MRALLVLTATAGLLSACGGGGSNDEPAAVTAHPLAQYVGNYSSCLISDDGSSTEREILSITQAPDNSLVVQAKTEFYPGNGCTGALLATETQSAATTISLQSTAQATISGYPKQGGSTTLEAARVTASQPAYTITLTGPAVEYRSQQPGGEAWPCIVYANGSSTCLPSKYSAESNIGIAFFVADGKLHFAFLEGSSYRYVAAYSRS